VHVISHAPDRNGGCPASACDAADERPGAVLQFAGDGSEAVLGGKNAMDAQRNAGVIHGRNVSPRKEILPSLRDSTVKFRSQPGTHVPGWVLAR